MNCINSFLDFCSQNRIGIIFVLLLAIFLGYIIGTKGKLKRNKI